jgi:arabinogalactan oligomer/maltooligosaccharide transport system permease protein
MFNTVFLITGGGPVVSADKPGFTEYVMIYMYNRILGADVANPHYGYIASFAITLFIILGILTFVSAGLTSKKEKKEGAFA